jgi:hypothetical protein
MLDLDTLAERRAKSLNQGEDVWRAAVWGPGFQKLSTYMSDGEVESLIAMCPSVKHLDFVVTYLNEQCARSGMAPFAVLSADAEKEGLKPADWIVKKAGAI